MVSTQSSSSTQSARLAYEMRASGLILSGVSSDPAGTTTRPLPADALGKADPQTLQKHFAWRVAGSSKTRTFSSPLSHSTVASEANTFAAWAEPLPFRQREQ